MFVKFSSAKVMDFHASEPRGRGVRTASGSRRLGSFEYAPRDDGHKYMYVAVRACTADVPNLNNDMLPHEELRDAYRTFVGSCIFMNHDNADPAKSRGAIIDAAYHDEDPDDRWVEILMEMDEERCPKLCSLIRSGEIDTVSMGCSVESTTCSVCGNVAEYEFEYCEHIRQKGREFGGVLAYEICNGIEFFEESWVYNPADVTATVQAIEKEAGRKAAEVYKEEYVSSSGRTWILSAVPVERLGMYRGRAETGEYDDYVGFYSKGGKNKGLFYSERDAVNDAKDAVKKYEDGLLPVYEEPEWDYGGPTMEELYYGVEYPVDEFGRSIGMAKCASADNAVPPLESWRMRDDGSYSIDVPGKSCVIDDDGFGNWTWYISDYSGDSIQSEGPDYAFESPEEAFYDLVEEKGLEVTASGPSSYALAPRTPDEVSTNEDAKSCPLCGSSSFDGEFCDVCGFQEPPAEFGDIELEEESDYEEFEEEAEEEDEEERRLHGRLFDISANPSACIRACERVSCGSYELIGFDLARISDDEAAAMAVSAGAVEI